MEHHITDHGSLAIRRFGGPEPPIVCLHGWTLHGGMFTTLAGRLDTGALAPDLPGHGASRITPIDLDTTISALARWLEPAGPHVLLGYSQGGRVAAHLSVRHPGLVSRLILVSTSTGLAGAALRQRATADAELAQHIEEHGMARFLDEWLSHPLVGTHRLDQDTAAADRRLREENTAAGIAAALRGLGQGVVPAIDPAVLPDPLWIAGGDDPRYATAATGHDAAGHGRSHIVQGTGHNVVIEAPEALAEIVNRELSRPS